MFPPKLTDEQWKRIEPLLPEPLRRPRGGRPPVGNREALTGILHVLRTGISWQGLPQSLGCGSGMTCWRRFQEWQELGVWEPVCRILAESADGKPLKFPRRWQPRGGFLRGPAGRNDGEPDPSSGRVSNWPHRLPESAPSLEPTAATLQSVMV